MEWRWASLSMHQKPTLCRVWAYSSPGLPRPITNFGAGPPRPKPWSIDSRSLFQRVLMGHLLCRPTLAPDEFAQERHYLFVEDVRQRGEVTDLDLVDELVELPRGRVGEESATPSDPRRRLYSRMASSMSRKRDVASRRGASSVSGNLQTSQNGALSSETSSRGTPHARTAAIKAAKRAGMSVAGGPPSSGTSLKSPDRLYIRTYSL